MTGYDFLEDAAHAVETELEGPGRNADTLIADRDVSPQDPAAWTATDLRGALLGSRHDLAFLAGHFSANSALAADYTHPAGHYRPDCVVGEFYQCHHLQCGLPLWL